jgi:hypothetical protein
MNRSLHIIQQKIGSMRVGLLSVGEGADKRRLQVSTSRINEGNKLNCVINSTPFSSSLLNREVVLIQKNNNDYLYVSCRVDDEVKTSSKVVSLSITKACWFVRKSKGSTAWLRQKYIYENPERIGVA